MIIATYESRCRRELAGLNSGAMGFVAEVYTYKAVRTSVFFAILMILQMKTYIKGQEQKYMSWSQTRVPPVSPYERDLKSRHEMLQADLQGLKLVWKKATEDWSNFKQGIFVQHDRHKHWNSQFVETKYGLETLTDRIGSILRIIRQAQDTQSFPYPSERVWYFDEPYPKNVRDNLLILARLRIQLCLSWITGIQEDFDYVESELKHIKTQQHKSETRVQGMRVENIPHLSLSSRSRYRVVL